MFKALYKFIYAGYNASYVDQTVHELISRTDKHSDKEKKPHIHQHVISSADRLDKCSKCCKFFKFLF